ncbi:hypothetical protein [Leminorella grimontii]|uniref:hypothetical protein n=1 Tax=Leminorella grimontii TaxID=82981 RepID=UPI00106DB8C7|nr:hypothetical protein [Leminorella grimontii]VFS61541.1 Uncharacterised protein [Leminorella grimontii]
MRKTWVCCLAAGCISALSVNAAADPDALLFIDSSRIEQQLLVIEFDREMSYSPTLQQRLHVQVVDVNPDSRPFSGSLDYGRDLHGEWVARYRPGRLPYLVCFRKGKETHRQELHQSSEIRICINKE